MKDEEEFKKKFEEFYPGAKLVPRTEEKTRVTVKRIKTALILVGLFIFCGILSGAPGYVYLICLPIAAFAGYFGIRESELGKED